MEYTFTVYVGYYITFESIKLIPEVFTLSLMKSFVYQIDGF